MSNTAPALAGCRRVTVAALAALASAAVTPTVVPELRAQATPSPIHALAGEYRRDSAASDDVNAAIDRAVREMNALTRPIGRRRLQGTNQPPANVRFTVSSDSLFILYSGQPEVRARRNGSPRAWRNAAGEEFTVRVTAVNDPDGGITVRQSFEAEDGRRENTWRLDPSGAVLRLEVRVSSPRLPQPLRYRQVFQRARD